MKVISIENALENYFDGIFIDVRSEGEYEKGHIPNAINLSLLDNNERVIIGKLYKQQNRETAIKKGLEFFGPKMRSFIEKVEDLIHQKNKNKTTAIILYCWRGGMRSNIIAWLLNLYGFEVLLIEGGYKSYRKWCLQTFSSVNNYKLIGGYTGTGKTIILQGLTQKFKLPVIDLEGVANHKGSAFGGFGMGNQPSQEMFENILALKIFNCVRLHGFVILEDESQRIGMVSIPQVMWEKLKKSSLLFLEMKIEERLENILAGYGKLDRSLLSSAIIRLQKKLGGLDTKNCLEYLINKDLRNCFNILLLYYDKVYNKSLAVKKTQMKSFHMLSIKKDETHLHKIYEALIKL